MLTKVNILEITDKMGQLLETSKGSMEKHTISPDQLYKNIVQLQKDLERVVVLIKRESFEN